MIDNREAEERVILVAVRKSDRENTEQSLDELWCCNGGKGNTES